MNARNLIDLTPLGRRAARHCKEPCHLLAAGFLTTVVGLFVACQSPSNQPPLSITTPTVNASNHQSLELLLGQLGSESFEERTAAQQQLDTVPLSQRPVLEQLASQSSDPEVQARLLARIADMDVQRAINPPPVSLHVFAATNENVADALSKAMGFPVHISGESYDRFTLFTDRQSYAEIYRTLSGQHPLLFRTEGFWLDSPMSRIESRKDKAAFFQRKGTGFAVAAAVVPFYEVQYEGSHRARPPVPEDMKQITVLCEFIADPRIKILEVLAPGIRSVCDDAGAILWQAPAGQKSEMAGSEIAVWSQRIDVLVSKATPPRSLTIKSQAECLVQVSEFRREIDQIDAHIGTPYAVGPRTVTLTQFNVNPKPSGRYEVFISFEASPLANPAASHRIECTWIEADGSRMTFSGPDGTNAGMDAPKPSLPARVIVSIPDQTTRQVMPFEIRDLILP